MPAAETSAASTKHALDRLDESVAKRFKQEFESADEVTQKAIERAKVLFEEAKQAVAASLGQSG
eukprot:11793593-Alexandrium_andersonii.AAC.1